MHEDEIIKETRRLRDEYAKQFNYDLDLIFEDLQKKQKEREQKQVSFASRKEREKNVEKVS